MALTRRAFAAATAAGVVIPTIARAKECPAAGMDWMTMSLEARNLAYFNVAHVGADFARQKTESWAAASKDLREQRPKHLDLAYGPGERTKWDLYPAAARRHRASSTFTAVTGSAAARKYLPALPKVPWQMAGRRRCRAKPLPPRRASRSRFTAPLEKTQPARLRILLTGRMSLFIIDPKRKPSSGPKSTDAEAVELYRTMIAYTGSYSIEGNKVTHKIEISWNQAWTGTNQQRFIEVKDNQLTIRPHRSLAR